MVTDTPPSMNGCERVFALATIADYSGLFVLKDTYLTVTETCAFLQVSSATVYRLLKTGLLAGTKTPSRGGWRITRDSVVRFSDDSVTTTSLLKHARQHTACPQIPRFQRR